MGLLHTNNIVVIAGNIGAGKTALARRLGDYLGGTVINEVVDSNPYLQRFYQEMTQWAFHLSIYFLTSRATQYHGMSGSPALMILDRSIYEDVHVFIQYFKSAKIFTLEEYDTYMALWELIKPTIRQPTLLVYLYAPTDILLARIKQRGRPIESGITEDYLKLLQGLYDDWLKGFDLCPILALDSTKCDFINDTHCLSGIAEEVSRNIGLSWS